MTVIDELILQCLILDGRAPFRRIAEVVGVSEQTAARRVRELQGQGLARVVVAPSNFAPSRRAWALRIRCRPDASAKLAEALAQRRDIGWIALVSGGSEITCTTSGAVDTDADGVLSHLPHSRAVLSFTAQALLRPFAASTAEWTLFDERLDDEQVDHMIRPVSEPAPPDTAVLDADTPLVAALARDGRASAAALARETGWPASRVSARLDGLLGSGLLHVATDFLPEAFGYSATAIMYLTVAPGRIVEVGEALATHRETGFVAATTGSANLFAVVTCRSSDDLFRYVSEQIGALPGVAQMDLAPYLRRIKQWQSRVAHHRLVAEP
ncbi:AsnC family transcriptional regulator [Actinomycetospora endophytica]|uniref:AsnC family transcriptional regulator n=1 Tax=Actinomycetospora endophytica TaxID=2291215 RepID=A0ABS8P0R9_9PSEU|nr:AsnC family transcriptional regulator [Actinomycetospora endophytica]MCD2191838.1 AsnC family transcriptional regulator [Actinomycetospora endophytica]